MGHEVLARKWRPHQLNDVVGQEHAVRILTHALESGRLHHAWLFTGTRGVGKTSIARIFAKALSCEKGIGPAPCDQCEICLACDGGYHIDLLEIDAASRTKVEDTRDLLETLQYAPARGRYKICLIDEVHMLSGHSFNALLKILEEPPAHVKFLLATTDPEKLPVTVRSRCLQLDLHPVPANKIAARLAQICTAEEIAATPPALLDIAAAGRGSLRDALSLLEQAIAFAGGNPLTAEMVQSLTGTGGPTLLPELLSAVISGDGENMLAAIETLRTEGADFDMLASGLLSLLHAISVQQIIPRKDASSSVCSLAERLTPEETQLFYQIALTGRRDLPFAPDPAIGFEMILLRMMAFVPASPWVPQKPKEEKREERKEPVPITAATRLPTEHDWNQVLPVLGLTGMTQALASHCHPVSLQGDPIQLLLAAKHASLLNKNLSERLEKALSAWRGQPVRLKITLTEDIPNTPAAQKSAKEQGRLQTAQGVISQDQGIKRLIDTFSATLDPDSIRAGETD